MRKRTVSIAGSLKKGRKLEGLTIVFGAEADRQYRPREIVERHRVAVSENSWEQLERIAHDRDVDCGVGQVRQLSIPWLTGIFHEYSLTIQRMRKNAINLGVSRMIIASSVRPLLGVGVSIACTQINQWRRTYRASMETQAIIQ